MPHRAERKQLEPRLRVYSRYCLFSKNGYDVRGAKFRRAAARPEHLQVNFVVSTFLVRIDPGGWKWAKRESDQNLYHAADLSCFPRDA